MPRGILGLLIGSIFFVTGCPRPSTDQEILDHLTLEFAAGNGALYPNTVTFDVKTVSHGRGVSFVGRHIVVTVDGRVVTTPSPWSGEMRDWIRADATQIRLWHMSLSELDQWLGGPGTYCLEASIGPAKSNAIHITLPGPEIISPPVEH